MKHAITPFPVGSQQGELVLFVELEAEDDPAAVVESLVIAYGRHQVSEVLVAPATLTGDRGRALSLALLQHWTIAIVGGLRDAAWPLVPGRVVLDVSDLFAVPMTDEELVIADLTTASTKVPQPQELFAIVPSGGSVTSRLLHILSAVLAPEFGSTLYVGPALFAAAIEASLRTERPWAIRPLGAITVPAPAASPTG